MFAESLDSTNQHQDVSHTDLSLLKGDVVLAILLT